MTTQGPSALPPTTILSSQHISQSAAHDFLSAYLDRAATDPALQPSAFITEHGPVSRTTAAAPNLTLHNLKRVQAGLAGEVLGRDLTVAKPADGEQGVELGDDNNKNDSPNTAGWQQETTGGDDGMGEQVMDVDDEAEAPVASTTGGVDKEERKKKKKERRLAEKRAKASNRDAAEAEE
ncbi:hypothetical protein MPDQ_006397 [Monascus purpureus]|uniref:Uncharacterized protein n=1 Tax=Monascus purpureus TaxID=5098 RepID=A0A507QXY2_MONPU|nr:hypothetical protein MPDQ_006397 [Monascus purpureus]BDD56452.1 hypothetical protein MAP00_001909 [Monascus purpureus]